MSETELTGEPLGRNDPCYCGSGKKYKQCHGAEEYARHLEGRRAEQAEALEAAVREWTNAGWQLESRSEDRAVVSRRRLGVAQRKLIVVDRYAHPEVTRL